MVTALLHPLGALELSLWGFGGRGEEEREGGRERDQERERENDLYLFRWSPLTELVSAASHRWASFDAVVDNLSLYVCKCMEECIL